MMFSSRMRYGCGDISLFIFHKTSCDHVIKGSIDFIDGCYTHTKCPPNLVAANSMEVEINLF